MSDEATGSGDARERSIPWIVPVGLALLVVLGACVVFPLDSDAAFVVFDPIWYGLNASAAPERSVVAHHLLFHVLAIPLTAALADAGFAMPGHLATRLLSGLGAATILLLFVAMAGPRRRLAGMGIFLLLLSSGGILLEAFIGENILPACAAALGVIWLASRPAPGLLPVLMLLVLALLLRQDNVFIVPGVLLAYLLGRERGSRLRPGAVLLGLAGVLTLGLYVLAWGLLPEPDFWDFMTRLGKDDYAHGLDGLELAALPRHLSALGKCIIGRQWPVWAYEPHAWVGLGFLGFVAALGFLLRGTSPFGRFAAAAGVTVALRIPFYMAFEPDNAEWWLLPLVLAGGWAALLVRGRPAAPPVVRRAASVLALVVAAAVLRLHLPTMLELRKRTLITAAEAAVHAGGPGTRYFGYQNRPALALHLLGTPSAPLPADLELARDYLERELASDPRPMILVLDLAVQNGMPADRRELRELFPPGMKLEWPGARVLFAQDNQFVVGFFMPP